MELSRSLVEAKAREYRESEPLYAVEQEHVEMLPGAFARGEFGWRDAEWVVQWYFRRYLGAYPDDRRRTIEAAFGKNDFETVRDAITTVSGGNEGDASRKLDRLTELEGVDVPVGSAFLAFSFPGRYVVVGDREWAVLREAGEFQSSYPTPPSIDEYLTYHDICRRLVEEFGVDAWTLYRALWRIWMDRFETP